MRIALVTEQFAPSNGPAAHVTREVLSRLIARGHDVTVFAAGRGHATFGGARLFWASRMTPVSAVREAMTLSREAPPLPEDFRPAVERKRELPRDCRGSRSMPIGLRQVC